MIINPQTHLFINDVLPVLMSPTKIALHDSINIDKSVFVQITLVFELNSVILLYGDKALLDCGIF